MSWDLYSGLPQISILDSVKAPGLSDRKSPNIGNMGRLTIAQPRELSRRPESKFEAGQSIRKILTEKIFHLMMDQKLFTRMDVRP